jgi:peptide deformylase
VRRYGDPVLRSRARPVDRFDAALEDEVARMVGLLGDAMGAGLAATQLGVLHRVFVFRAAPDAPIRALVNPELEWASDDREADDEGCLSIPGVWVPVERPSAVRMRGRDARGREQVLEAAGIDPGGAERDRLPGEVGRLGRARRVIGHERAAAGDPLEQPFGHQRVEGLVADLRLAAAEHAAPGVVDIHRGQVGQRPAAAALVLDQSRTPSGGRDERVTAQQGLQLRLLIGADDVVAGCGRRPSQRRS